MFGWSVFCTLPCVAGSGPILRRASTIATTLITAALVSGCGGGSSGTASLTADSSSAHKLLVETFAGHRAIKSGVISLGLKVVPTGSSTLTRPIELSIGGPFTGSAGGKLPQSDFTIAISAQGQTADLQVISAAGKGYVSLAGQSFELPASSYAQLRSGLGSLSGSSGRSKGSGSNTLDKLGIRPLAWVEHPRIAGSATVDGAATTHISARVDAAALVRDLSKLVASAGSLTGASGGRTLKQGISPVEQRAIVKALRSPHLDVWTGTNDRILRKLTFKATVPVTGTTRTELGGMTSAVITFDLAYRHLNQPQTITAPTSVQPYSVFRAEVAALLQGLVGTGSTGTSTTGTSTTGSTTTGTGTTGSGSTGTIQPGAATVVNGNQKYSDCITAADGDVSKMQKCSKLLTSP